MRLHSAQLAAIFLTAVLIPLCSPSVAMAASPPPNGSADCPSGCWTATTNSTSPALYQSGQQTVFSASFSSSYNTTSSGTVFVTFQDQSYFFVSNATGNLMLGPQDTGTVDMQVTGLQIGTPYVATYYAVDANNDSMSSPTTAVLALVSSPPVSRSEPVAEVTSWLCNSSCGNSSQGPDLMVTFSNAGDASISSATMHGLIAIANGTINEATSLTLGAYQSVTLPFYAGGLSPGEYSLSVFATGANGSAISATTILSFQIQPNGLFFVGDTTDFTLTQTPSMVAIANPAFDLHYANDLNFTVVGIVWLVVHNASGQTVSCSTSTLSLGGGVSGNAYNTILGLPPGKYSGAVFVTSVSSVAISSPVSSNFTV